MRGVVMTARGKQLNMEALALKAKRPLNKQNIDMKDQVPARKQPVRQLNIKGFMPAPGGVAQSIAAERPAEPDGPSMADFTGIKVENPKFLNEKPQDPVGAADKALQEIVGDLEQFKVKAEVNSRRGKRS